MKKQVKFSVVLSIVVYAAVGCGTRQPKPVVVKGATATSIVSTSSMPKPTAPTLVDGKPAGYTLEWSDDFRGTVESKPDGSSWGYDTGTGDHGWGNSELETYVNDQAHCHVVADVNATDGKALQIQATRDGTGHYQSTRINTSGHISFQNGYIEARMKLPEGKGLWPSFWMMGTDLGQLGWPACGMINVMSTTGDHPTSYRSELYGPGFGDSHLQSTFEQKPHPTPLLGKEREKIPSSTGLKVRRDFSDTYHTFGVLWEDESITFYVDGVPYATRTVDDIPGHTWPFQKPFFFLINLAVGGTGPGAPSAGTKFPASLMVDYMRVYKKNAGSEAFNGPHNIPGKLECEDFDDGGEGIGYFDKDGVNNTGRYRPGEGVDVEQAQAPNDGYAIGWTSAGQWVKYTVIAGRSGAFQAGFRVAAGGKGGSFHVEDESGKDLTGPVKVAPTGGWQKWTTVNKPMRLTAGRHVLKLVEDTDGYNLDYITFS